MSVVTRIVSWGRQRQHTRHVRAFLAACACAAVATGVLLSIPLVFGSPVRLVEITWRGLDDPGRRALEEQFRLYEATRLSDTRWQYLPGDASADTLGALLQHPSVTSTSGIDRRALRISSRAPLSARRGGLTTAPNLARGAKLLAAVLFFAAALLLIAAASPSEAFERWRARLMNAVAYARTQPRNAIARTFAALRSFLERGVPVGTAESAAAFRITFGLLVLSFLILHPARDIGIDVPALADVGYMRSVIGAFASPGGLVLLDRVAVASAVLVVAGLFTPFASIVLAGAFYLWASIFTLNTTHHPVSTIVVSLICLAGAPSAHVWSVDSWVRRRPAAAPSKRYGFVYWLPGFIFGVAFLAAAWSKISPGPAWILNGTVRYHFAWDSQHALVPWGLTLTRLEPIAIAMSAGAVAVELGLIAASFTRSLTLRLALGISAAMLLGGFALFQGVFWPGWWMLLLSFLPWQMIGEQRPSLAGAPRASETLSRWQVGVLVAVLAAQATASLRPLEVRPVLSAYDMYSTTYATPEDYQDASNLVYRVLVLRNGASSEVPGCELDDKMVARISVATSKAEQLSTELARAGRECEAVLDERDAVTLVGDRPFYDFEAGRHVRQRGVATVGPIDR